jgi:hypothetical protein
MARFGTAVPRRVALEGGSSSAAKLIFALVFACFWNGIVSVFLIDIVGSFRGGSPDWFGAVFMTPFVAVGVGAIGFCFYAFLAMFNPRAFLTVSANPVSLDETLDVEWATKGSVERIKSYRITLEGREAATYTRGTTTSTDTETFSVLEIAKGAGGAGLREGRGKIAFPANAMHTFDASCNKIVWMLHVKGDIPFWPDVDEEFEIKVEPRRVDKRA